MGKTIVCRCEDVTRDEILSALEAGMTDIESLKRYLAIGTGPCQAKSCLVALTQILIEQGCLAPEDAVPIISRPPLFLTALKFFAGTEEGEG